MPVVWPLLPVLLAAAAPLTTATATSTSLSQVSPSWLSGVVFVSTRLIGVAVLVALLSAMVRLASATLVAVVGITAAATTALLLLPAAVWLSGMWRIPTRHIGVTTQAVLLVAAVRLPATVALAATAALLAVVGTPVPVAATAAATALVWLTAAARLVGEWHVSVLRFDLAILSTVTIAMVRLAAATPLGVTAAATAVTSATVVSLPTLAALGSHLLAERNVAPLPAVPPFVAPRRPAIRRL